MKATMTRIRKRMRRIMAGEYRPPHERATPLAFALDSYRRTAQTNIHQVIWGESLCRNS
jgi:hypothetical protein